jgi:hypothetical protein
LSESSETSPRTARTRGDFIMRFCLTSGALSSVSVV